MALGLLLAACKPDGASDPHGAAKAVATQTVAVSTVTSDEVAQTLAVTGTVMPWQELGIDAEASGLAVVDVPVKENDRVHAGDVLVRLDDRVLRAQISQQQATVAEAQANLKSARQESARGDLLLQQKSMSQEAVETRRTAILTSQAKLDAANASLDQLQAQLDHTVVKAPTDGVVSSTPVRLGTVTQAGTELLRLIRDGRLEEQAKVPEQSLTAVKPQQVARITGPDGTTVTGTVRDVATKLDAVTRLGTAYVDLPSGTALRPGMFASVAIAVAGAKALVVPETALVWPDGRTSAYVLKADNTVSLRELAVTGRQDGRATVARGLAAGDRVVVAGGGFLHDGDRVTVAPALKPDTLARD